MARFHTRNVQAATMLRSYPHRSVGNVGDFSLPYGVLPLSQQLGEWHGGMFGDAADVTAAAPTGASTDWTTAAISAGTQLMSAAIPAIQSRTGKIDEKAAKKLAKLEARAAKVKNPRKRATLDAKIKALRLMIAAGGTVTDTQLANIDSELTVEGVPDNTVRNLAIGGAFAAALALGGLYYWKRSR